MKKKRRRVNKIKAKAFLASIKNEITKKYRVHSDFVISVIKEEIKPYEDDLKSYEKKEQPQIRNLWKIILKV